MAQSGTKAGLEALLLQYLNAGVVVHAADSSVLFANDLACRILGRTPQQIRGLDSTDLARFFLREDGTPMPVEELPVSRVLASRQPLSGLIVGLDDPATRERKWAIVNAFPETGPDGQIARVVVTFVEITARKRAEERQQHLVDALRAVRAVDQLIVQEKNPDALLRRACGILTETRGYRLAWIGVLEPGGRLRVAGESGAGPILARLERQLERGEIPCCYARTLDQPGVVVTHDPVTNCPGCPVADIQPELSILTTAIRHQDRVHGVLAASLPAVAAADPEEHSLFLEIAGDLGYALHTIEVEREQRRVTEALRQNEALLREVGRIAEIGGWEADLVTRRVLWTRTCYDLVGLDPAGPAPGPDEYLQCFIEEDRPRVDQAMRALVEDGAPLDIEARAQIPSRGLRWFRMLARREYESGRCGRLRGTLQDITERKRTEAAATTSRARLDFALEKSGAGGWDLDLTTHEAYRTVQHARIFGYDSDREPWSFERFLGHILPEDRPEILRRFGEATAATSDLVFECRIRRVDGVERWIRVAGGHVLDAAGVARRLAGIVQDVTEERQAVAALRESEQRFQRSFHGSPVAQSITTVEDGLILEVNEAFHRLVGRTREQCLGRSTLELGIWAEPVERDAVVRELRETGAVRTRAVHVGTASGEVRSAILSMQVFDPGGEPRIISTVVDISDLKRAEEAVRESERRFAGSFHGSAAGQVITRITDGTIVEVNEAMCRMLGVSRADVIGRTTIELGTWVEPGQRESAIRALETDGVAHGREVLLRGSAGEVHTCLFSAQPIDLEGEACLIATVLDITESRRAEAQHVETDLRHRLLFEQVGMAIVYLAPDGILSRINRVAAELLGRPPEEVEGLHLHAVFGPEIGEMFMGRLREALESDALRMSEDRLPMKDGWRWFSTHYHRAVDGEGRVLGLQIVANDITDRKAAELAMAESEQRFRTLVDLAPDGIFVHSEGVVRFVNSAMVRLLGARDESELVGREIMSLVAPEYRDAVRERIQRQRVLAEPAPPAEGGFVRLDGAHVPVETSAVVLRFEQRESYLVLVRDITARREAEREQEALRAQLEQAQKMESVGRLAGGIAHDFNNILMVQKGYCELMRRGLSKDDPLAESLAQIDASAERAAGLTRQLLAFSRRQTLLPRVIDLNVLLGDMGRMLQRLIGEDVELITVPAPEPAVVKADPGQIEQVIVNLSVNARDAMPSGGRLTIELREVWVEQSDEVRPAGRYVELSVHDTGCGMDAETRRRIFEPFFTTKPIGRGTGLGLSTVDGIVHQSGGNIGVESQLRQGTTFRVWLPRVEDEPAPPPIPERRAVPGRGESVLIVEDEATLRQLMVRQIEGLGYRPMAAANGGEALILVEENGLRPELVVTDVVMPGMSGRVLMDRLRRALPDAKVIFMSGYTDDSIVQHGVLEERGTYFLSKPFSLVDLAAQIRVALGSRRSDRAARGAPI
jgi:two-component system, cell cycle sensor histidine kinase and response regulator CckA